MAKKNITKVFCFLNALGSRICSVLRRESSQAVLTLCLIFTGQPLASETASLAREALLKINSSGFDSSLAVLEELGSRDHPEALLALYSLHGDGHFLPVNPIKSQYYLDRSVVTGYQRAIWTQAFRSNDRPRLRSLYEQGFATAACTLSTVEADLDKECYAAIKAGAFEGEPNSLYALKVFRRDPAADALLKQFPYPRVLGEIASNQWSSEPDENSLSGLVELVKLGSVRAAVEVIKPNPHLDDRREQYKRELMQDLSPADKQLIGDVLKSVASGDRAGWFGSEWSENDAIGRLFFDGEVSLGIRSDYGLAFAAYQQCAESQQDLAANLCLFQQALIKETGGAGLMRSPSEAFDLYIKSHQRGNWAATAVLANAYQAGRMGLDIDLKRAADFGILAVERGNQWAAEPVAMQYLNGEGVSKDPDKAAYYLEIAARKESGYPGSPRAMVSLADLNESNAILGASLDKARFWFKAARDADDADWHQYVFDSDAISSQKRLASEGFDRVSNKLQSVLAVSTSDDLKVSASADYGNYKVLIIANQRYENLTDLTTPKRDAALIGAALESRFGATVEYLFDVNRVQMLSALNRYRKELMPEDNFILYYAGHGVFDEELKIGYWQPADSTIDEDFTWIATDQISRTLSGFRSRNALVIADSCFSGSVVRGVEFPAASENSSQALLALSAKKTRMAITSGGLQPVLDVTGNSLTSTFASKLADLVLAVDRPVPISSLFPKLRSAVTAETAAWGYEQIPEMAPLYKAGHDGGDFILNPRLQVSN